MGLDITAYSKVEWAQEYDCDDEEPYERDLVLAYTNPDFPGREGTIRTGWYECKGESLGFRAGSYSGYNRWREWLSDQALGVEPEHVWKRADEYAGRPFFALIHFSDCEGVLGPEVCGGLLADFKAFQPVGDDYALDHYAYWTRAMELGADGGMVVFH